MMPVIPDAVQRKRTRTIPSNRCAEIAGTDMGVIRLRKGRGSNDVGQSHGGNKPTHYHFSLCEGILATPAVLTR